MQNTITLLDIETLQRLDSPHYQPVMFNLKKGSKLFNGKEK